MMTASRQPPAANLRTPLLEVQDLRISFHTTEGVSHVLNGVDLTLHAGESVGLVGETGCGKSVTLKAILGLLAMPPAHIDSGRILFKGQDLLAMPPSERQRLRGRTMAFIPQEPVGSLNPVFKVGDQLVELIRWQARDGLDPVSYLRGRRDAESRRARQTAIELLEQVQIADPERVLDAYPVQLSGGMAQRVLIAMALAGKPTLLLADEPGTALDVTTQHTILELLRERIAAEGLSLLYVTHNLGVAREMTERVYVMYAGDVAEVAQTANLFDDPRHPYTRGLLESVPRLTGGQVEGIPGIIPDYDDPPAGCRFHPRCSYAMPICSGDRPRLVNIAGEHQARCVLYYDDIAADAIYVGTDYERP
jgi:oligopeptide/dipeptide ABC transporter ATP-binding protein